MKILPLQKIKFSPTPTFCFSDGYKEIIEFTEFDDLEDAYSKLQNDSLDSILPPKTRSFCVGDVFIVNEEDVYCAYMIDSIGFKKLNQLETRLINHLTV